MPLLDRTKSLCLACSASLPPLKSSSTNDIFTTKCCQRPICPACIISNPRLSRYNPCLACLGGINVVASTSGPHYASGLSLLPQKPWSSGANLSEVEGAFILGDDDDEDLDESGVEDEKTTDNCDAAESVKNVVYVPEVPPSQEPSRTLVPYKYYLNRSDTLQGLSLRFGLDVHEICKLNNLPASILRTTPHLLHTRAFLILPPSAKPHPSLMPGDKEEKLVRERAEKKLQTLTKEIDWRVAKAYVALADDEQEQEFFTSKRKEMAPCSSAWTGSKSALEALAIERYLDDLEWEAEEMRAGRDVKLLEFHFADFEGHGKGNIQETSTAEVISNRLWWPWSSP